ncbi:MAG: hypothetical protein HGA37_01965 [Lentimicrobium sp.]|nr:hypothetical protein [Lentimicrobium sp.]
MNNLLLSFRWKVVGLLVTTLGVILLITYFWFDFRFKIPVFAVYSVFLETKTLEVFRTNFADELIMLLLISGLGLIIFSKEKKEVEGIDQLRLNAFAKALMANIVLLLFSVLFIFGSAFMAILVVNILSFFVFYLFFFYTGLVSRRRN